MDCLDSGVAVRGLMSVDLAGLEISCSKLPGSSKGVELSASNTDGNGKSGAGRGVCALESESCILPP